VERVKRGERINGVGATRREKKNIKNQFSFFFFLFSNKLPIVLKKGTKKLPPFLG